MKSDKEFTMHFGAEPHVFKKAAELRKQMTEQEKMLWGKLRKKQLEGYKFRRQHPVYEFIVDFYCHQAKLIIEVDGEYHNWLEQKEYDNARTKILNDFGVKIIRFSNKEIEEELDKVLEVIKRNLE